MTVMSLLSASTLSLNMCNQKYMRYLKRASIEGAQLLRELSYIGFVEHLLGLDMYVMRLQLGWKKASFKSIFQNV